MQWSQGRTRQNLLHSVREAKQKAEHIRRSFESLSLNVLYYQTCPILCQCFPTVDNLRNLFLTPTPEVLSFFQKSQEAR